MEEIILEAQEKEASEVVTERTPEEIAARELEDIEKAKKAKRAAIFDKITTGILIALMASPFVILAYIFIWFITA
jgi:hypothetical protein